MAIEHRHVVWKKKHSKLVVSFEGISLKPFIYVCLTKIEISVLLAEMGRKTPYLLILDSTDCLRVQSTKTIKFFSVIGE